jgi:hypothetical protein
MKGERCSFRRRPSGPQFELAANPITQNSVGADLLTGSSFFTYQGSARLTVDFGDLAVYFVASTTGNENAINFPLGTKPNYTDLQQLSSTTPAKKRPAWVPH